MSITAERKRKSPSKDERKKPLHRLARGSVAILSERINNLTGQGKRKGENLHAALLKMVATRRSPARNKLKYEASYKRGSRWKRTA